MPNTPSFREELISQIPALQLLMGLGYEYLTPDDALAKRGGKFRNVILEDVLLNWLRGVPSAAWEYRLGTYSALEWVLERYKEKKPKDPTIAEKFNTYRFADYKEAVIKLLGRVCAVSVKTMEIISEMQIDPFFNCSE